MLSHHLWAKVTELSQLPLSPSLMGTRCPKPAGNCWDVLMLPWTGKGKGLEVSPVPATPGDKPRGALPSRERWESSTFPRGCGWTPGSDRNCGTRNDKHSRQSKPHPASSALPAGTRSLLLHSTAPLYSWGFCFSSVAAGAKLSSWCPGAQRADEKLCLAPAGKRHQPGGRGRKCCLFGASIAIACTGHELGLEFNVHTIRD